MSSAEETKIPLDGIKVGLTFKSKESALDLIDEWCKETFHPLRKKVFVGSLETGGNQTGRIQLSTPFLIFFSLIFGNTRKCYLN